MIPIARTKPSLLGQKSKKAKKKKKVHLGGFIMDLIGIKKRPKFEL